MLVWSLVGVFLDSIVNPPVNAGVKNLRGIWELIKQQKDQMEKDFLGLQNGPEKIIQLESPRATLKKVSN